MGWGSGRFGGGVWFSDVHINIKSFRWSSSRLGEAREFRGWWGGGREART